MRIHVGRLSRAARPKAALSSARALGGSGEPPHMVIILFSMARGSDREARAGFV
jgi:hypothetical protein